MHMTQKQFCRRFGFNLAALRHWERGDRRPGGAARTLLLVVRDNPRAVVQRGSDGLTAKGLWAWEPYGRIE